jgi:phosphoglycerate dehydrogenase-like enzyme
MGQRPLVVVTDFLAEAGPETPVLSDISDLRLLQTTDEADVIREASAADVLLVYHDIKLTERSIAHLGRCKGIIRCGVGYDNVDIQAAGKRGIVVCNVPDYGTEEVADHALMLLLAVARRLLPADAAVRRGVWEPPVVFGAPRLRGKTVGILGCGRIGSAMALRARALGLRVVFYDPYQPDGLDKALGVERVHRLDELWPRAEFLSLHCPLTRETRHIVNADALARLPRGAYVLNTARGPCIDLTALLAALDSGHVAAAGLDVVEREPLDDERIRRHSRIVLTPHVAFYSVEGYTEMRTKGAQEARRLLLGEAVRNPVNLHCLVNPRCVVPRLSPPEV